MASGDEEAQGSAPGDVEKVPTGAGTTKKEAPEDEFPGWRRVALIMVAVYLCMFLVALDRTIIGTAIPRITDEFKSIADLGWYASAYLLTTAAFQLIYGRIYKWYSPKIVLLWAIFIFEVGSAICGAAPTSKAFIVGRAVAGVGSAGIFAGVVIIMVFTIPLNKRPIFQGLFGAIFGLASVLGPLLGGVFTTKVSWRWCFYINLPIGAAVVFVLSFILKAPSSKSKEETLRQQIMKLDPYGTMAFLPGVVCLLLALQWGGTQYHWADGRIIALFILAAVLLVTFVYIQFRQGENATIPFRIIKQRSIASGVYFSLLSAGTMLILVYYLPLWFQAIKGVSAIRSGIYTLPLVMSLVIASIIGGSLTAKTGYYTPQLIACSIIMSIGAGLLTTLHTNSGSGKWIGYQVLFGFGLGLGLQQAGMAAQTCLDNKDVTTGVALMFFCQGIGGSIFISIAETVFTHSLVSHLGQVTNLDARVILKTGATELRHLVPPQYLEKVLVAYNAALSDTFKVAVGCAACSIIAGLTMEWRSVKGKTHGGPSKKEAEKNEKSNMTDEEVAETSRDSEAANGIPPETTPEATDPERAKAG